MIKINSSLIITTVQECRVHIRFLYNMISYLYIGTMSVMWKSCISNFNNMTIVASRFNHCYTTDLRVCTEINDHTYHFGWWPFPIIIMSRTTAFLYNVKLVLCIIVVIILLLRDINPTRLPTSMFWIFWYHVTPWPSLQNHISPI